MVAPQGDTGPVATPVPLNFNTGSKSNFFYEKKNKKNRMEEPPPKADSHSKPICRNAAKKS